MHKARRRLLEVFVLVTRVQLGAGRGGAVGKRSRMRPGLPDHYNMKLQRPLLGEDKAGTDITHIDVRALPPVYVAAGSGVACAVQC
jgi:hypothetical protein